MTRYVPFFRLHLAHDYFGSAHPPISIVPDRPTSRLTDHPDIRMRVGTGWIEVYASEDRSTLRQIAAGDGLVFTLRLRPQNPTLTSVTATISEAEGRIAVIDRDRPESGALFAGETLGEAELRPLQPDGIIVDADLYQTPLAIVRLTLDPDIKDARYALHFGAAERFWTYHVTGGRGDASLGIRDKSEAISFEALGEHVMANGVRARSFRSSAPIPARARPENRFELVSEGPFGPRVLLSALPCPRPGSGRIEKTGSVKRAVSEVYLNLL